MYLVTNSVYTSAQQPLMTSLPGRRGAIVVPQGTPTRFVVYPSRPNPFADRTVIQFDLPAKAPVRIEIFDAQGRFVRRLADGERPAGRWSVQWNRTDGTGRR